MLSVASLVYQCNYAWRLLATGFCFTVFGVGGIIIPLFTIPILYMSSRSLMIRQRNTRKLVHFQFKGFIHMMGALGLLTWRTEGLHKLNREGLLILANHPTLIDIVFLLAFVPNADCIVKSRLLDNPTMRKFISMAGYITNDRGVDLIDAASQSLACGNVLVIFPEGTRTRQGEKMKFQRGAANIAVRCQVDVTPIMINCVPPTLNKNQKWYNIPKRPFEMTFTVCDDIAIKPFIHFPASLGARRLTRKLEYFYTEARQAHGH